MDELITRISDKVGIDADTAQTAVTMMLGFLQKEGDDTAVAKMMAAIPGADNLEAATPGGLLSKLPGGGVMGLGQALMGQGLGMGEITGVAKETISFAKEKAGDDVVDDVVNSISGLSQFV